jgi:DegV family protein with EDD domain
VALRFVTDSTTDLPPGIAEQWNIQVVPLYVNFQGSDGSLETLKDGVDIDHDSFYRRLGESTAQPTTSQPTVEDFLTVYRELTEEGHQVVSVHISSKLSGTINSATQAASQLGDGASTEVVDLGLASMAVGIALLAGVRAAEDGADLPQVVTEMRKAATETRIYFMVDTLEYLQKGGRIGKAQAFLGSLLSIKPILSMENGEIRPLERVRTRSKALSRLASLAQKMGTLSDLCVIHNTTPQDAQNLKEDLAHLAPPDRVFTSRLGPVIGAHVGPGTVGLAARPAS